MGKETERIYTFTDKELERLVQISARESIKAYISETEKIESNRHKREMSDLLQRYREIKATLRNTEGISSESAKKAFLSDLEAAELPVPEDKVLGCEDFLSKYKESDPSAFLPDKPAPTITVPGQGPASKKTGQQLLDEKYKNNPFYHPKGE